MLRCGNCQGVLDAGLVCANNDRCIVYRCHVCDHENTFNKITGSLVQTEATPVGGE